MSARPKASCVLLASVMAGCPLPVATDTDGSDASAASLATTGSLSTDSASATGALPTSDGPEQGTSPSSTSGTSGTSEPSATTADSSTVGTTIGVGTTGDSSGTSGEGSSTGTSSTGTSGTGEGSSSTGAPLEPPPGCDMAVIHEGELIITDDTVMDSLKCIVEVTGRLKISDTKALVSFPALGNLKRVGDDVEIFDNAALADIDGLAGLEHVDGGMSYGEVTLYRNPALTDLKGLKSLQRVDSVQINDNDALVNLAGITGDLDGVFQPGWSLALIGNDGLTTLAGIEGIVDLDQGIYIADNANLADISALATVLSPTITSITIAGNPALQDLQGLEFVVAPQIIYVERNDALVDLTGLDSLATVVPHGILIEGNAKLATLAGLESLAVVTEMIIEDNPALVSLGALAGLSEVPKTLWIGRCGGAGNDALIDLHGLEGLTALLAIRINENDALQSIAGLPAGIGLKGIEAFNNPLLPAAMLADYAAQAGIVNVSDWLCNNAGAPAECACIIVQD